MKRYIITGAPGVGKTTLLNALASNGHQTFEEISRKIILSEQKNNSNRTPWGDTLGFSELIIQYTTQELKPPITALTFVDRGLADSIAYLKLKQLPIKDALLTFDYHRYYYKQVFMLPPWKQIYRQDPQRLQTYSESLLLHELLLETYRELDFEITLLPKADIEERVKFIEGSVQQKKSTFV